MQPHDAVTYMTSSDEERDVLRQMESSLQSNIPPKFVGADGKEIAVPAGMLELLRRVVSLVVQQPIMLLPGTQEVTVHEAAQFLNVPETYLNQMVDKGELPASGEGDQRHIRVADIITYDRQRQDIQRRAIDEIAQMSQDCGAYN